MEITAMQSATHTIGSALDAGEATRHFTLSCNKAGDVELTCRHTDSESGTCDRVLLRITESGFVTTWPGYCEEVGLQPRFTANMGSGR